MPISQEERACITRHNGERYESGLLWKKDDPKLQNNFFAAQRRFFSLENKFAKNPVLAETYKAVIVNTYVNLKHARRLSREEIDAGPAGRTWYNPHHRFSTQTNRAIVGWYSIYPQNTTGSAWTTFCSKVQIS